LIGKVKKKNDLDTDFDGYIVHLMTMIPNRTSKEVSS